MSYCITEINSFKIQSSPVRCFVAHRSCSKQTFKMTLAGRKGTEDESKWKHRMNLENRDWFQRLLWIGSWRGRSRGTRSPVELSSSFSLSSFFNGSFFPAYMISWFQQGAFPAWLTILPHATRIFSLQVVCCREFIEGFRIGYAG